MTTDTIVITLGAVVVICSLIIGALAIIGGSEIRKMHEADKMIDRELEKRLAGGTGRISEAQRYNAQKHKPQRGWTV